VEVSLKVKIKTVHQKFMPIILDTQEAEIRRIRIQNQPQGK
jgi:hypothetical protein